METPNQNRGRNRVLLITGNSMIKSEMGLLLSDKYSFYLADELSKGMSLLEQHYDSIAAVLLDTALAVSDNGKFIKDVSEEPKYMFIPIVLTAPGIPSNDEIECLSMGAVDIIVAPFHKKLTQSRIENAIRIKDSASFYEIERMLKALPSNIYLKDAECKYIFATHYWHHLDHHDDPDWTIRGKTDVDIRKDKENAFEAMEADREIMRTGKGTSYIIEINADNIQEFYEVIKQPVRDENNKICGIVGLINNITEQEKMRHKLKYAAETDGLTKLQNRTSIQRIIEERLASFKNGGKCFSLIMLDIDNFKRVNDTYGHKAGDDVIKALAGILREGIDKGMTAGRWGGEEFMILVNNADIEEAAAQAEKIRMRFADTELKDVPFQTISLGAVEASCQDTIDTLCTRVDMCLYNAKESGKNRVVTERQI